MIKTDKYKLYKGDCLELMKDIPDKSIDMILCDLPYGTTWSKWDSIIDFKKLWEEYNRICKGAIVLFSSQPFTTKLINSNIKNFKYTWYWIKNIKGNYLNAKRQPLRQLEEINVFDKHNYYPQGIKKVNKISKRGSSAKTTMQNYSNEWVQENEGYPSNILYFDLDKEKFHPTQKPIDLLQYLIKTYTNEGELVLDNCMGSGSTGVACLNTNRKFIGMEKEDKYFDIAKERIVNTYKELNKEVC
ncbi:site-specific DNA-methyltransferase [Clostridium perfringens]|uniref:DNA-methyltransferase n=1 Tax=Clostridium perfringens TaxID=1502 RepID=UPI001F05BF8D|nr:site-specific DNA-methyltransferase [Clostridium perfringens]MCH1964348.1 site-specific DNA-methyltransferase [Clostridium perfringens]